MPAAPIPIVAASSAVLKRRMTCRTSSPGNRFSTDAETIKPVSERSDTAAMGRALTAILALLVLAGACGGRSAGPGPANTVLSSTAPVPTAISPVQATVPAPSPSSTDAVDGSEPLLLALSVHVERHPGEAADRTLFEEHLALLDRLASTAEAHGVVLNFEAETEFVTAASAHDGATAIGALIARGHRFSQHSGDRSTSGLDRAGRTAELRRQRDALASLGVDARYLSGACPGDGWVEAAVDAGFEAATGLTEICLQSLDDAHLPAGMGWIRSCASATICHDVLQLEPAASLHPWTTDESAAWLTDVPDGALLLVAGHATEALTAMSAGTAVDPDAAVGAFTAELDALLAARTPGRLNATGYTLSVGPEPDWTTLDAILSVAASRAGQLRWVSYDEIIDLAAAEAGAPADPPMAYVDTSPDTAGSSAGPNGGGRSGQLQAGRDGVEQSLRVVVDTAEVHVGEAP